MEHKLSNVIIEHANQKLSPKIFSIKNNWDRHKLFFLQLIKRGINRL